MSNKQTIVISAAAGVAALAVAGGGIAWATQDDPRETVAPVQVGSLAVDVSTEPQASPTGGTQQVAALERLEGRLDRHGDDVDDFSMGGIEVEFGPEEWVLTAGAQADFDGDGTEEDLLDELDGLVGQEVTALVRLDDDGDEADVYELNGLTYRDSAGGPAPWQQDTGTTGGSSEAATTEEVAQAAAAAVGPGARVTELDAERTGDVAWEADVVDRDGVEYEVLLDAAGEVLDSRRDD